MEGCKTSAAEFTWSFPILAGIPFVTDSPKAEIGVDFDVVRVEQGACEGEACELEETGPLAIVKWLNKEIAQKEAGQACQLRCEAAVCGIAQACGTKACGTKACETKACGQAKACGTQVCGTKACGQACDVASKQTCHSSSTHTAQSTCPTTKSAAKGQCPITAHSTWFHAAAKNCPIISGQVTAASCPEGKCQCGTKCQCGGEQVAKLKQKLQKTQLALMVQETISGVRQEAADRQRELQIQLAKAEARVEAQQAVIQFSVQHQQQQQQWLAVLAAQAPAAHQQATKQQVEQLAAENARLREVVEELQQHIRQASKANASSPYTR